jgi:serine/threonine-protein phosphatase 2B catalytic subunit
MQGVSFHFVGNRTETFPHPLVTTVFSAPNYCGTYGNRGAILRFTESEMKVWHQILILHINIVYEFLR